MRVIITTGGTGGHIYPALSLANELIKENPETEILFIGTENHMESTIIPSYGYRFYGVSASGLMGSVTDKLKAGINLFAVSRSLKKVLKEFEPDIVVGFGGYASVPAILAANRMKCPVILHEQNSYPGKANLFLARYAKAVVVCYKEAYEKFPKEKTFQLGNPRSSEVANVKKDAAVLQRYGLTEKRKTVLIVMGSQGSESVNEVMYNTLKLMQEKEYQVLYVTGKKHYNQVLEHCKETDKIKICDYINQVEVMANVDLIISRGGATTAAEITAIGLPSIIIPSPYVANNHQVINAQALVNAGASIMIEEKNLTGNGLLEAVDSILEEEERYKQMHQSAIEFSTPHAAQEIIQLMRDIVG